MKLLATPKSHFSRKVRLLLDHMATDYEWVDVGNVAANTPTKFSGNPMMSVPVLEDGSVWMVESDHIASYIVRTYDSDDPFGVLTDSIELLNARAVMNGIMGNEVKLILSARTGLDPTPHLYFQKAENAIIQSLTWLEAKADLFGSGELSYADFHFISMWDHLKLYGLLDMNYPKLTDLANKLSKSQTIQLSAPSSE